MNLKTYLSQPIDNSALVLFRIFFGLLMFFESFGAVVTGWVQETFVDVNFTFNFIGFDFLQVFVGPQMYLIYFLMGLCGLLIAFGLFYRWAIVSFTLLWAITYFGQKTHYNNHYYLILLISFLLCLVPANRYAADDVKFGYVKQRIICPRWAVAIFMFQVAIVYFYAAIAKIYPDWLAARPVEIWFTSKSYESHLGNGHQLWSDEFAAQLKHFFSQPWVHQFFSYMGIIFDLLVVPLFLWNKWTRWLAVILSLCFHLLNSAIFQIGVFPYFALAFVIFFFEPETIRKRFFPKKPKPSVQEISTNFSLPKWFVPFFTIYFVIQIFLPLRHHLISGNVLWDESGHRLSWRMMLRTKSANTVFSIEDKNTGVKERVNAHQYVKRHQYGDLISKPDLMWQFAQRLKRDYAEQGKDISVYVDSKLGINGRKLVQFTNPDYDIADEPWHTFGQQPWVLEDNIVELEKEE